MINIEKTENEKHLEIYLKMIGKKKTDKFELYQLLDLMNIAQDLVNNINYIQCCTELKGKKKKPFWKSFFALKNTPPDCIG